MPQDRNLHAKHNYEVEAGIRIRDYLQKMTINISSRTLSAEDEIR
jgi:hypothetical protein